jgi:hypothetical protein
MKTIITLALISAVLCIEGLGQAPRGDQSAATLGTPPLDQKVAEFELKDSTLKDGIAELSSKPIGGLHLGIEEILREKMSDPEDRSVQSSMHLENETVRKILDALCRFDSRYTWSTDGSSINIYPRAIVGNRSYLLNLQLQQITLTDISYPDEVFLPLHREFPKEHLGYIQTGGDTSYLQPWTVILEHLTVRELINRVAEHLGPRSSWIFHGSKDERFFTFQKGAFHTHRKS